MKKIVFSLFIILILFAGNIFAADKEVTIVVDGMVCSLCAQGIEKKFSAEPAVEKIRVNLKNKQVILTLKSGMALSDESIKKILVEAGYDVEKKIVRN